MTRKTKYLTLTEDNFHCEVLEAPEAVLVVFLADWCGPCHILAPVIEDLASDFEGQVKVGKLDVENNTNIAAQYGIRSTPTLMFFKGGQVVDHVAGAVPKRVLEEKLRAVIQRV